jgi:protein-L-isoaspartate(D-aspartate) O-methyltransferase
MRVPLNSARCDSESISRISWVRSGNRISHQGGEDRVFNFVCADPNRLRRRAKSYDTRCDDFEISQDFFAAILMGRHEAEREDLVEQLRLKGISDERVLNAVLSIPRHEFVLKAFFNRAYEDTALPIENGQTISQPYTVAFMTQELALKPGAKILEIGTGSGYQSAILAALGCRVYTIERHYELHLQAKRILDKLGHKVSARFGDGTIGWVEFSPFDGIVVTAAAPEVPQALLSQLGEGGRLVVPVGDLDSQRLRIITRVGKEYQTRGAHGFKFVPLIGKQGWDING